MSPSKIALYRELIDFFMDSPELRYRALVADKRQLRHDAYDQSHDDWYYKRYYLLLNPLQTATC